MSTKHVICIDDRVENYQSLVADLDEDTRWLLLDPDQDGIAQMASALSGYHDLDSIQIISHGSSGTIQVGSTTLDASQLDSYTRQLAAIGSSLTGTGDILLYGCNVAQGQTGSRFIHQLATLTGADIAASDDITGSDGDWILESSTGAVTGMDRFAALADIPSLAVSNAANSGASIAAVTPDLMNQAQNLSASYKLSAINIGTRFATLVYGDINLSANTDDYLSSASETVAASYWGSSSADAGFDDDYSGFFSNNTVLGSHWRVLDDELPGVISGSGTYSAAYFPTSTVDGMTTYARFTTGGLYHAYISSFWHIDQATNGYGDSNALVLANNDTLVLAFRGTDAWDHALTGGQTWIGDGQYLHYEAFRPLLNSIQQYIQAHDEIKHIIVAGHSLAGALVDIFTAIDARNFATDAGTDLLAVSLASPGLDPDLMTDMFDSQSYYGRFDQSVAEIETHWFSDDRLFLNNPDNYYAGFANNQDRVYFDNLFPSSSIPSTLMGYWPTDLLNENSNFDAIINNLPNINRDDPKTKYLFLKQFSCCEDQHKA